MAGAQGIATLNFSAGAKAARYRAVQVVADSAPNPNLNAGVWPTYSTGLTGNWSSMAFGNGVFVAVALSGTNLAASSTDGVNWVSRSISGSTDWPAVAFGNGKFVAVGGNGTVAATSTDGVTWTPQTMPVFANWNKIVFGNGVFLALGQSSTSAATSSDGVTWVSQTMPASQNWNCAAYGNGLFVVMLAGSTYYTSPDGAAWTTRVLTTPNGGSTWLALAFGGGAFVATSNSSRAVVRSSDGISWSASSLPVTSNWYGIAYGNGIFVAVAYASAGRVACSYDGGGTWLQAAIPEYSTSGWWAVAFGQGVFSVLPQGLTTTVTASPNGYDAGTSPLANTRTVSTVNVQESPALPSPGSNIASATVTGQAGLLPTHAIDAWVQGDSTADHSAYEHTTLPVKVAVTNVVSGVGFDVTAYSELRLKGDFKVRWVWTDNANTGSATINFGTGFGSDAATVTVTGLTTLSAGSYVQAWVQGSDSTADNTAYEHTYIPIRLRVTDKVAGVGFTIRAQSDFRLTGGFKVRYAFTP